MQRAIFLSDAIPLTSSSSANSPEHLAQPTNGLLTAGRPRNYSTTEKTTTAIVVGVDLGDLGFTDSLKEACLLTDTAGAVVLQTFTAKRRAPDAVTYIGSGKVIEIAAAVAAQEVDLVVFNVALSPGQQRNLERELKTRVLDRTTLILDIFAMRARSHEGKLQVELAQLQHLSTRLVRGWTHLERQKGGIGLRGPGETQLETDRRLLGDRIKTLKARLAKVQQQNDTRRKSRARSDVFSVSLVGYTNAGKSTLFNALTKSKTYAADQLFATLDTTTRRIYIESLGNVVISDTVGFIRDLPHELVAAFRSTLEESIHADLLLQVVDINHPMRDEHIRAVNQILKDIKAPIDRQVLVFNKADLLPPPTPAPLDEHRDDLMAEIVEAPLNNAIEEPLERVVVSAKTGLGLDLILKIIIQAANRGERGESYKFTAQAQ